MRCWCFLKWRIMHMHEMHVGNWLPVYGGACIAERTCSRMSACSLHSSTSFFNNSRTLRALRGQHDSHNTERTHATFRLESTNALLPQPVLSC